MNDPTPRDGSAPVPRPRGELTPSGLLLPSAGAVVAALVTTRLGLAGTIIGTALVPMILILVKELGRSPIERASRTAGTMRAVARRGARSPLPRVRWPVVATTTALAFAVAVTVVTVPELAIGESIGGERRLTFAAPEGGDGSGGATPTTTAPVTEQDPVTTVPEPQPDPDPPESEPVSPAPAETAPAPPAPEAEAPQPPPAEGSPAEPPSDGPPPEGATTAPG